MTRVSLRQTYPKRIDVPVLLIISGVLLGIGLSLPLIKVEQLVFWKSEYSVMAGVLGLMHHGDYFLAALIFFFSVVFPIAKLVLLWGVWEMKLEEDRRNDLVKWLGMLGKWSMLDVFVVALIVVLVKLGPLAKTTPQGGVYVFCAAILTSMISGMLIESLMEESNRRKG